MKFVNGANKIIEKELNEKSTLAYYCSLKEDVNNKYQTRFVSDMQTFVTRFGIIISKVSMGKKIKKNTYLEAIDFLCNDVLKNKNLHTMLKVIEINNEGNKCKHSINNISIDIAECVRQYNRLIKALVDIGFSPFSSRYLKLNTINYRDTKVFEDKYEEKFCSLAGTKFSIKLLPDIKLDKYEKTINAQLVVSWINSKANAGKWFNIEIYNKNKLKGKKNNINLGQINCQKFTICVKESDLDRRKLSLCVKLHLLKNIQKNRETRILFWKKNHQYTETIDMGQTEIMVSMIV